MASLAGIAASLPVLEWQCLRCAATALRRLAGGRFLDLAAVVCGSSHRNPLHQGVAPGHGVVF